MHKKFGKHRACLPRRKIYLRNRDSYHSPVKTMRSFFLVIVIEVLIEYELNIKYQILTFLKGYISMLKIKRINYTNLLSKLNYKFGALWQPLSPTLWLNYISCTFLLDACWNSQKMNKISHKFVDSKKLFMMGISN